MSESRIDFLACGGHKWLLAPIGIGFLYVRQDAQPDLWPVEVGHHSVEQDPEHYTSYRLAFRASAEKFEASVPNYAGVFGLNASLDLLHAVGSTRIAARVLALTDRLCDGLAERGYRLLSPRGQSEKSATVSFVSGRRPSKEVFELLTQARIVVSIREGAIRVAPHFYNTEDEIDRLLAALPPG